MSSQISVERSVFSSLGTSVSGNILLEATYGEAAIGNFSSSKYRLTVGFHQSVDLIDGLSEIDQSDIVLYPNPAQNHIEIHSESEISRIKIVDLSGKILFDKIISTLKPVGGNTEIDVSKLSSGMYIVQIVNAEGLEIQERIIIQ